MCAAVAASACLYTIVMFYFTRLTSAVTATVAGSMKLVLLIVIPALIDPRTFSALNWAGAAIFFAGFVWYSIVGHQQLEADAVGGGSTEKTPLSTKPSSKAEANHALKRTLLTPSKGEQQMKLSSDV